MKNTIIILLVIKVINVHSQVVGTNVVFNGIKAHLNADGILFQNNTDVKFESPVGTGLNTFYAAALWGGGKDINNNVFSFFPRYTNYSNYEVRPGPIMDSIYYTSQAALWNKVWKISKWDILYHVNNYTQPGYIMLSDIATWPAHGNIALGQAQNLAPFIDVDNDGMYNPMNGDFPAIKGDDCLFVIYNDDVGYSYNMKAEVHLYLYGFSCGTDSSFNNTLFINYKVHNRSNNTYYETYLGMFADMDIGASTDDYIGTDVQRSSIYCYNSDDFDESNGNQQGYLNHPPSQSVTLLKGVLMDYDGFDNPFTTILQNAIDSNGIVYPNYAIGYSDGIIDNERTGMTYSIYFNNATGPQSDPTTGQYLAAYGYLTGFWKDNSPFYYGGNAYQTSIGVINCGHVESSFIFPGTTDPVLLGTKGTMVNCGSDWNELNQSNVAGDRRGVMSTGKFTFYPNDLQEMEFALVFGRDYNPSGNHITSINLMQDRIDSIKFYYQLNQTPCGNNFNFFNSINEHHISILDMIIYPNPAKEYFNIDIHGIQQDYMIELYNAMGQLVYNKKYQKTENNIRISTSYLADGVYFLKISNDEQINSRTLIIQK